MYKVFKEELEVESWFNKHYLDFLTKIRNDSNVDGTIGEAIFAYTGSMSVDYNMIVEAAYGDLNVIESITNMNLNNKQDIIHLYKVFNENTIPENIILYHFYNKREFKYCMKRNKTIQINKFISTTCLKESDGIKELVSKNNYNTVLKIKVKKGTPCIPVGNNPNSLLREYEVILKPQSKIRITKIKYNPFSKIKREIECELL